MSAFFSDAPDAVATAGLVRARQRSAVEVTQEALERIGKIDPALKCCTAVLKDSAVLQAEAVDRSIAAGGDPGPLAGVPFAVKNLFDVAGVTTLAGSRIHALNPPAQRDATAVERLKQAGAVLVAALNMDEYAYGFTTENSHYGTTRNPHDLGRVAGGAAGGGGAGGVGGGGG